MLALINTGIQYPDNMFEAIALALLRGFASACAFLCLQIAYRWLRNREGIGSGDVNWPASQAHGSPGRRSRLPLNSPPSRRSEPTQFIIASMEAPFAQPADCRSDSFLRPQSGLAGCWKQRGSRLEQNWWSNEKDRKYWLSRVCFSGCAKCVRQCDPAIGQHDDLGTNKPPLCGEQDPRARRAR